MASLARSLPFFALFTLVSGAARAQQPQGPGPAIGLPSHPSFGGRPGDAPMARAGIDCAIVGIAVNAHVRRSIAVADVAIRVRAAKGGTCLVRAEGAEFTTSKSSSVFRVFAQTLVDDQASMPFAVAETPGRDRLPPFRSNFSSIEEHTVVFRTVVEGDGAPAGGIDAPARVVVKLPAFGARLTDKTPITMRVAMDGKGKAAFNTGNPRLGSQQQPTNAEGIVEFSAVLSKEDLTPTLDWLVETTPDVPAITALKTGLVSLEYMREGFARDFVTAIEAAKKDEKKIEAAWDAAYDTAVGAMRSPDPLVAGIGVRAVGWLASALIPSVQGVRGPGEAGDGLSVPAPVAEEATKATEAFFKQTGLKVAPSAVGSRAVRPYVMKLGQPGARKKEADEGLKRLAKRLAKKEGAVPTFVGVLLEAPLPKITQLAPPGGKLITFGPKGAAFVGASRAGAPPKRPIASRLVHGFTHKGGVLKVFLAASLLGAAAFGAAALYREKRDEEPTPV